MSTPFQNRLVGTIIVTAAIVIFLPGILDGEKKSYQSDFDNIPKTPVFTGKVSEEKFPEALRPKTEKIILAKDIAKDDELQLQVEPETSSESKVANKPSTKTTENTNAQTQQKLEEPIEAASGKDSQNVSSKSPEILSNVNQLPEHGQVNEAWVIQLGSFQNEKNVEQLILKLKQNGYVVFTKPIQTQKGTLTKVFVGPELIKSSISKKIPHLKTITGVQGKVARFDPTQ
ncbi:MAG: SPOR domain-containing protein [Colwellia sp.]